MSNHTNKNINIDIDNKLIKFTSSKKQPCRHQHIEIDPTLNVIICVDCKSELNPVIWLLDYMKHLKTVSDHNNYVYAQVLTFKESINELKNVVCSHCHNLTPVKIAAPNHEMVKEKLKVVESENLNIFKLVSNEDDESD